MSVVDHPGLLNRMVQDPTSLDVADIEIWQSKVAVPQGALQAVEIAKIKNWGELTPLYTEGTFAGKEVSRQGDSPFEFIYREAADSNGFATGKTDLANFVPGVYNADTLGIRPDLVGREVTTWADLISPDFKGKTAIQNIPTNGIMDAMMAFEAAGMLKYGDKGNPTQEELTATIAKLIELKKGGHFRALWNTFDESVNLMASGEVVIQSMWSPAVTAVQTQGIKCIYQPLKEGYRGWGNGLGLLAPSRRPEARRGLRVPQLVQFRLGRRLHRQAGLLQRQPEDGDGQPLTENERGFFYEGKAATADITSPTGEKTNSAGDVRDGGSYEERFSKVACLEQPHGRGRVPLRQVERVQRRITQMDRGGGKPAAAPSIPGMTDLIRN